MLHLKSRVHAGLLLVSLSSTALLFAAEENEPTFPLDAACRPPSQYLSEGQRLFELETFGGNGRTCLTCHSRETGTVSPRDAQRRFQLDADDPLFLHDGSDDGQGNGVRRMLSDATVLVEISLPPNVRLADDPGARSVVLRRGIPSTLNTPALDPVLMLDGRQPRLEDQAADAIAGHAQASSVPTDAELESIAEFQRTERFFSSEALLDFARGGEPPTLPEGRTLAERRGRRFFENLPPGEDRKDGLCSRCHSGAMLNQTDEFLPVPVPVGTRFIGVRVSELNAAGNPVREFIFDNGDGTERLVSSPDPGRALITGVAGDVNRFKIPSLWGVSKTAPYFHDNSAQTLDDLAAHYARFFALVAAPIVVTPEEQADMVAYMKLL